MLLALTADELLLRLLFGLTAAVIAAAAVASLLKGRLVLFVLGLPTATVTWWLAAFQLARPESWWARRFYDGERRRAAAEKYGDT